MNPVNVWLIFATIMLWLLGVVGISESLDNQDKVNHISLQLTEMTPGADVHVNTTVAPAPTVLSPLTQTPCVAARLDIFYTYASPKKDSTWPLTILFVGPDPIPLLAFNTPLAFHRTLWQVAGDITHSYYGPVTEIEIGTSNFWKSTSQQLPSLPPSIAAQIPPDLLALARKENPKHFTLREWVLTENAEFFVVGSIVDRDPSGTFILGRDPNIDEFLLYPGLQANFIRAHQTSFPRLRVIGVLCLVLGFIPLAIMIYRQRKHAHNSRFSLKTLPPPP